jgi:L-fuconolactonase
MKIDSHQHFWIYNSREYDWIDDRMKLLRRDYLPADLEPELKNAGYSGSVAVQARQSLEETRWLIGLSEKSDFIKGVVGWVDLRSEKDLKKQLDEFCRSDKFVGVRHVVHDEPDDNFMLRDDFLRGISILNDYNITYDLLLFPKHLPVAREVVSMFPKQKFVVDHISKPLIRDHLISPWKEDIIQLARNKNVWCKLSGMVTEADWTKRVYEDFDPYLNIIFDAFGTERLMTGSDWPVCKVAGEYSFVTGLVENYITGVDDETRLNILGNNCTRFYNLKA